MARVIQTAYCLLSWLCARHRQCVSLSRVWQVRALLDPRACNVACSVAESEYSAAATESDPAADISRGLEVLEPNRV